MKVGDRVTVNENYVETDKSRLEYKVGTVVSIDDLPYPIGVQMDGAFGTDQFELDELDIYTLEPPC